MLAHCRCGPGTWCCPRATRRRPAPGPEETLSRRGHKDDPLYRIRRTLLSGIEHPTEEQRARLAKYRPVGDPNGVVEVTWSVHRQVRSNYHAESPFARRRIAEKVLDTLHTCPIAEVKRLGRTLRWWRPMVSATSPTTGSE